MPAILYRSSRILEMEKGDDMTENDWRESLTDEEDPDDDEMEETPRDVVLLLGFDPLENDTPNG